MVLEERQSPREGSFPWLSANGYLIVAVSVSTLFEVPVPQLRERLRRPANCLCWNVSTLFKGKRQSS